MPGMKTSSRMTAKSTLEHGAAPLARARGNDFAEPEHLRREEVALVVVDEEHGGSVAECRDIRLLVTPNISNGVVHGLLRGLQRIGIASAAIASGAVDPHPDQRQQQVDVDRLGDIIAGARIEAFGGRPSSPWRSPPPTECRRCRG